MSSTSGNTRSQQALSTKRMRGRKNAVGRSRKREAGHGGAPPGTKTELLHLLAVVVETISKKKEGSPV